MEFDTISPAVEEILESMWATDPADGRFPRDSWPHGCCEFAAVVLAAALEDAGLGQWTFVSAGESGDVGHAWLEWRTADGVTLYSIDVTIHQFHEWDEPFIGEGVTPAVEKFSPVRYAGPLWEWPYLGDDSQIFWKLIRAVREELGRRRSDLAQ